MYHNLFILPLIMTRYFSVKNYAHNLQPEATFPQLDQEFVDVIISGLPTTHRSLPHYPIGLSSLKQNTEPFLLK